MATDADAAITAALAHADPLFSLALPDAAAYAIYELPTGARVVVWADGTWMPYVEARAGGLPPPFRLTRVPAGTAVPPALAAARASARASGQPIQVYRAVIEETPRQPAVVYQPHDGVSWVGDDHDQQAVSAVPAVAVYAWACAQAFPLPTAAPPTAEMLTDRQALIRDLPLDLLAAFYRAEQQGESVTCFRLPAVAAWALWLPAQGRLGVRTAHGIRWHPVTAVPTDWTPYVPETGESSPGP